MSGNISLLTARYVLEAELINNMSFDLKNKKVTIIGAARSGILVSVE